MRTVSRNSSRPTLAGPAGASAGAASADMARAQLGERFAAADSVSSVLGVCMREGEGEALVARRGTVRRAVWDGGAERAAQERVGLFHPFHHTNIVFRYSHTCDTPKAGVEDSLKTFVTLQSRS